jgi:hypothetical protein
MNAPYFQRHVAHRSVAKRLAAQPPAT